MEMTLDGTSDEKDEEEVLAGCPFTRLFEILKAKSQSLWKTLARDQ